jgi:two-component system, OmpR family, KDP operon response regulator KdpE
MGDRVLVVDDEPSILRVVAANLRARGYEALTAASGTAALTVIETHQPDCVVLDLGLPDVGGLEVLRRLRAWTTTPVVILTAVDDEADKAIAFDLGADDYVTKPFTMTELLARSGGRCGTAGPRASIGREPSRSARSVSTLMPAWSPGGGSRWP